MKYFIINTFLFFCLIVSSKSQAQEAPGIIYFDSLWHEATFENHEYYRVQSMNKDGLLEFKEYWKNGQIQSSGTLSSLEPKIREGEWKYYYKNGNIKSTSHFLSNNLIGTHNMFDSTGKLEKECVYQVDSLDNISQYLQFKIDFPYYLSTKAKYPNYSRRNNEQGKVVVSLEINPMGKVESCKILNSVSYQLDAAAIKVIKNYKKYPIAIYHGKPVTLFMMIPVNFKLSE